MLCPLIFASAVPSVSMIFAFLPYCIRYLLLHNKLPLTLMAYNNTYYLELLWVRNLGVANQALCFRALTELQSKCQPGLYSQGSSTGGITFEFIHMVVGRI